MRYIIFYFYFTIIKKLFQQGFLKLKINGNRLNSEEVLGSEKYGTCRSVITMPLKVSTIL